MSFVCGGFMFKATDRKATSSVASSSVENLLEGLTSLSSDLLVELSPQEQQLISGGARGIITGRGKFRYGNRTYPATILVRLRNLPSLRSESPDEGDEEQGEERDFERSY